MITKARNYENTKEKINKTKAQINAIRIKFNVRDFGNLSLGFDSIFGFSF
jgi:hypothetical protein